MEDNISGVDSMLNAIDEETRRMQASHTSSGSFEVLAGSRTSGSSVSPNATYPVPQGQPAIGAPKALALAPGHFSNSFDPWRNASFPVDPPQPSSAACWSPYNQQSTATQPMSPNIAAPSAAA